MKIPCNCMIRNVYFKIECSNDWYVSISRTNSHLSQDHFELNQAHCLASLQDEYVRCGGFFLASQVHR